MNLYEHTLVARQDSSESQLKSIKDKYSKLIEKNEDNVIDSVLIVDIPGEFSLEDYGIINQNINTISLISPTTNKDRIKSIAKNSTGFVYYVTLRGVTGSSNLDIDEINQNIEEIKQYASVPTLAGFGIKTPQDAKLLAEHSDGVIIGSSLVKMIEEKLYHFQNRIVQ